MARKHVQQRRPPLKGVIVGAGYFSGHQLEAWSRIAGVRITGITDLDAKKARARAAEWHIPAVYPDAETMVTAEQPDFVDIITPPETHRALVGLAAEARAAVLCQKPLAPTFAEARQLIRFCTRNGVRMMVNENWRWQAWFREARRLIDAGGVGEIANLRFHLRTFDGAGPHPYHNHPYFLHKQRLLLEETVVHFLDTCRFLAGDIHSVFCSLRTINPRIQGEDTVNLLCRFDSGAIGYIDANRTLPAAATRKTFGTCVIEGAKAVLDIRGSGRIRITDHRGRTRWHAYPVPRRGYFGDGCKHTQQHFVDALRAGTPFETDGPAYLPTLAAVEAGYRSARTRRPVVLRTLV